MIKHAILNEDEDSLVEIAKVLSIEKYTIDGSPIAIDRSKVAIPLTFSVSILFNFFYTNILWGRYVYIDVNLEV